eukprot:NODE_6141_length_1701_cov_5.850699.p1 GENE.NODE_6141_length_1701_cov_5.850699~~NODE_6141_length_1701_cov_5.850699.p1  ORF type:complete len:466 (+),score=41.40 NODE_6141_length_1701_cov_5.850699:266-1663(+)
MLRQSTDLNMHTSCCVRKSRMSGRDDAAIASRRGLSRTTKRANAHAVLTMACGTLLFLIAAAEIAVSRGRFCTASEDIDHEVLARPTTSYCESIGSDADAIDSSRGPSLKPHIANAHDVVGSSSGAALVMVGIADAAIAGSSGLFCTISLAQDHGMPAMLRASNDVRRGSAAEAIACSSGGSSNCRRAYAHAVTAMLSCAAIGRRDAAAIAYKAGQSPMQRRDTDHGRVNSCGTLNSLISGSDADAIALRAGGSHIDHADIDHEMPVSDRGIASVSVRMAAAAIAFRRGTLRYTRLANAHAKLDMWNIGNSDSVGRDCAERAAIRGKCCIAIAAYAHEVCAIAAAMKSVMLGIDCDAIDSLSGWTAMRISANDHAMQIRRSLPISERSARAADESAVRSGSSRHSIMAYAHAECAIFVAANWRIFRIAEADIDLRSGLSWYISGATDHADMAMSCVVKNPRHSAA